MLNVSQFHSLLKNPPIPRGYNTTVQHQKCCGVGGGKQRDGSKEAPTDWTQVTCAAARIKTSDMLLKILVH